MQRRIDRRGHADEGEGEQHGDRVVGAAQREQQAAGEQCSAGEQAGEEAGPDAQVAFARVAGAASILARLWVRVCVRPSRSRTVTSTLGPARGRGGRQTGDAEVGRDRLSVDRDQLGGDGDGRRSAGRGADEQLAVGGDIKVETELVDDRLDPVARADRVDRADDDGENGEREQQGPDRAQPFDPPVG